MRTAKQRFMEATAPKWGDEAAEYRWKLRQLALSGVPAIIVFCCALLLHDREAVAFTLLAVGALLSIPQVVPMFVCQRRMYAAAARTLGVEVGRHGENAPPKGSPAYEEWCENNGLIPFSASDRNRYRAAYKR